MDEAILTHIEPDHLSDIGAERAILRLGIYGPPPECWDRLKPEHFGTETHRDIFRAVQRIISRCGEADPDTVKAELSSANSTRHLPRENIDRLVASLYEAERHVSPYLADEYLRRLEKKARQRALWEFSEGIRRDVADGRALADVTAKARAALDEADGPTAIDLSRCSAEVGLTDARTFTPAEFIPSPYLALNAALGGGFARGELTTLFGPSSIGKTVLAVNFLHGIAGRGIPCAIVSLEMSSADLWKLLVAIHAGVPRLHLRSATLTDIEAAKMRAAVEEMRGWPLYVLGRRAFAPDREHPEAPDMRAVGAVLREGAARHGWQFIALDYLAKVGPFDGDEPVRIPRLTSWAFDCAQRLNLHFLALAQSNKASWGRKGEDGERALSLEDVRGVVQSVSDADNVLGIIRADFNSGDPLPVAPTKLHVLKARHAAGGTVHLSFDKGYGRFDAVGQ